MMYPYPRTYPNEAVELIAQYYSDPESGLEKKDIIHAGWVIAGYTLSKMFGGGPQPVGAKKFKPTKTPVAPDKITKFFEELKKANRYGTFNKFEENNPSCWHHLHDISKTILEDMSA
jgi:hypothetical protein